MQIGQKIFLFFAILVFAGCSSVITRRGYSLQDIQNKEKYPGCNIPVKKKFQYDKNEVEVLGEIKAGDSGFSVTCGETHVLNIFRQEACALGADLINITSEHRLDIASSCYRARAEFLRFKDREKAKNLESDVE